MLSQFTFPNLPTDNLYKFIALFGLLIIFTTLFGGGYYVLNINIEIEEQRMRVLREFAEIENLNRYYDEMEESLSNLDSLLTAKEIYDTFGHSDYKTFMENSHNRDFREQVAFVHEFVPKSFKLVEVKQRLESKMQETKDRIIDLQNSPGVNPIYSINEPNSKIELRNAIITYAGLLLLLGVTIATFGFYKWYFIVQKPMDKLREIELSLAKEKISKNPANSLDTVEITNDGVKNEEKDLTDKEGHKNDD